MLKELAAIWRDSGIMKQVVQELGQMVADAQYVYTHAWEVCVGQAVIEETKDPLREADRAVNRGERGVRRMLVEHLTLNPGRDVSGCLAVMVMAKDIERIGDLAKDIFSLGSRFEGKARELKYFDRLDALSAKIGAYFPELQRAILDSNEEIARAILESNKGVKKECGGVLADLYADNVGTQEAVTTALLVRHFRRVNAHLCNAASGIIFPIEDISFVSRGLKKAAKPSAP